MPPRLDLPPCRRRRRRRRVILRHSQGLPGWAATSTHPTCSIIAQESTPGPSREPPPERKQTPLSGQRWACLNGTRGGSGGHLVLLALSGTGFQSSGDVPLWSPSCRSGAQVRSLQANLQVLPFPGPFREDTVTGRTLPGQDTGDRSAAAPLWHRGLPGAERGVRHC